MLYGKVWKKCIFGVKGYSSLFIIAGGNAGVGLETAVDMATRGARVVLGCRNKERAQKAVGIIKGC